MKARKFLTADNQGFALYEGDKVFSRFHCENVIIDGIYVDASDGEVFLTCTQGVLRVNSATRLGTELQEEVNTQ